MSEAGKLKVAILADDLTLKAWQHQIFSYIASSSDINLCGYYVKSKDNVKAKSSRKKYNKIIYKIHTAVDKVLFPTTPNALLRVDVRQVLEENNIEVVELLTKENGYHDHIHKDQLIDLRNNEIDILIRFGFRILAGDILDVSNFGVWSLHHGDNEHYRGAPPGYWEVVNKAPVSGSIIQRLTNELDNGVVISRKFSTTESISINRNRNFLLWNSVKQMCDALKKMADNVGYYQEAVNANNKNISFYAHNIYTQPGNISALINVTKIYFRILPLMYKKRRKWKIGLIKINNNSSTLNYKINSSSMSTLNPPAGHFWADPHLIEYKDGYYLFIEEYSNKLKKGHILLLKLDSKLNVLFKKVIIDEPFHLSNPFVFWFKGVLFCIPECNKNNDLRLYKCINFPDKWTFEKKLMSDIRIADVTLEEKDDSWYLFGNVATKNGSLCTDLHVFKSDSPISEDWEEMKYSPVYTDSRISRMAGRFFRVGDNLYRPSQNSEYIYGKEIVINKVLELSDKEFSEEIEAKISPTWEKGVRRTHSFSFTKSLLAIDYE